MAKIKDPVLASAVEKFDEIVDKDYEIFAILSEEERKAMQALFAPLFSEKELEAYRCIWEKTQ